MKKFNSYRVISGKTALVLGCFCFILSSCLKNKDSTANGPKAQMGITNYVVNGAAFNIFYDDSKVTTVPLSFGKSISTASLPYVPFGAGIHNFKLTSGTVVVANNSISLESGQNYSLYLYDTLKNDTLKAWLLTDNLVAVDTAAKARFLQFIPGADSLTIYLVRDTIGFAVRDTYIGNKSNPGTTLDFFITMPPGNYKITLQRKNATIFQQSSFTVQRGKLYSFIARGIINGTGDYKESVSVVQHN